MKILNCHIRYCQDLGSLRTPVCPTSKWSANHIRGMCSRGGYWPFTTFLGMFLVRYLPHWKRFLQKLPYFSLDLRPEIEMPRRLANSSDAGDFFERKLTSRWLVWTKNMLISNNGWRRFGRVFTKLSTTGKYWYLTQKMP